MLTEKTLPEIQSLVNKEMDTLIDRIYTKEDMDFINNNFTIPMFSDNGLSQAGTKFQFPAPFMKKFYKDNEELADTVLKDRVKTYFEKQDKPVLFRSFLGKTSAVLSDKYQVFDDDSVLSVIEDSKYLTENTDHIWADISPERFHARFINKDKLTISGDTSPLSMAVFIDNSMCGTSSFKVRFGLYRWACTNGCIAGLKEFTLIREVHMGKKPMELFLQKALADAPRYQEMLFKMAEDMNNALSSIYNLSDEDAKRYIKDRLNCGIKTADKVMEMYQTYGGQTKWHLMNAITDVSHELSTPDRIRFEERAMKVA